MMSSQNPSVTETVWTRRTQRQEQEWWAANAACPETPCTRREIASAVLGSAATMAGPVLALLANLYQLRPDSPTAIARDTTGLVLLLTGAFITASANRSVSMREASALGKTLSPYRFSASEPPL
jgi:hypothetical protein